MQILFLNKKFIMNCSLNLYLPGLHGGVHYSRGGAMGSSEHAL